MLVLTVVSSKNTKLAGSIRVASHASVGSAWPRPADPVPSPSTSFFMRRPEPAQGRPDGRQRAGLDAATGQLGLDLCPSDAFVAGHQGTQQLLVPSQQRLAVAANLGRLGASSRPHSPHQPVHRRRTHRKTSRCLTSQTTGFNHLHQPPTQILGQRCRHRCRLHSDRGSSSETRNRTNLKCSSRCGAPGCWSPTMLLLHSTRGHDPNGETGEGHPAQRNVGSFARHSRLPRFHVQPEHRGGASIGLRMPRCSLCRLDPGPAGNAKTVGIDCIGPAGRKQAMARRILFLRPDRHSAKPDHGRGKVDRLESSERPQGRVAARLEPSALKAAQLAVGQGRAFC